MNAALDRDALYYPYIHFQDINWLKATLLCFHQVRRMVPPGFSVNDSDEVKQFGQLKGSRDQPLIEEEGTDQEEVYHAQKRLLGFIEENEEIILNNFTKEGTDRALYKSVIKANNNNRSDSFVIHRAKMMYELVEYLEHRELVWPARNILGGYEKWYALNPILGEAIMSVIAINIAVSNGLDIVTSSGNIHHAIVSLNEKEVFDDLIQKPKFPQPMDDSNRIAEITDELALMVMNTHFDLNRLSAAQIAELIKEGKDLRKFKDAIVPIAQRIPDIRNPEEREKRLKQASDEVIDEWHNYKKSLPRFALDALMDVSKIKPPEVISGIAATATSSLAFGVGIGLTIGFVTYSGYRIYKKYKEQESGPYQYLSRIQKSGATLTTRPEKLYSRGSSKKIAQPLPEGT